MEIYIFAGLSVIFAASSVTAAVYFIKAKNKLEEVKIQLAVKEQEVEEKGRKLLVLDELLVKKTEAETKMLSLREQLEKSEKGRADALREKELAIQDKNDSQRREELARQRIATIENEMLDWKKTKEQHMEAAKASIAAAGAQLSSKLLDDHKREAENARKENEKIVKATTEDLHKKFQNVFESMSALHEKVEKSRDTVDVVRRALLSPSGAGSLAEITLENIFKASGLVENQDYRMQYSVKNADGADLRPDAVVFLPGNNVLVVDSKASKFFLELGEAGDDAVKQKELEESLKKTMNKHLKDLVSRNYRDAVEQQAANAHATILMFLPSDSALERLRAIDGKFTDNAWKERIIPVGPSGLVTMLINATMLIANARQDENSQKILGEVKDMLNAVVKLHELAGSLGRGLKAAMGKYDQFAGSFDRTFMSKAKRIEQLGPNMPKLKDIQKLERYKVDMKEIEGEVVEELVLEFEE